MTRLHQAFWPYVGMDDDMTEHPEHIIQPMRFWQEVYIAAIKAGYSAGHAKQHADQALLDFQIKTKMPYPQEGNE